MQMIDYWANIQVLNIDAKQKVISAAHDISYCKVMLKYLLVNLYCNITI